MLKLDNNYVNCCTIYVEFIVNAVWVSFFLYIAIHNGITKVLANVERAVNFTIINTELLYQMKMILNVNKCRKILFLFHSTMLMALNRMKLLVTN